MLKRLNSILIISLLGVSVALPWLLPFSTFTPIFGWISALGLCLCLEKHSNPIRIIYGAGCFAVALAFSWLFSTIADFGGFPTAAALAIFLLFVFGTAAQFALFAWIGKRLLLRFPKSAIIIPIAWITAQNFSIRIFPWELAHTQLNFPAFASIADLAGTGTISFLMIWICTAAIGFGSKRSKPSALILPLLLLLGSFVYGQYRTEQFKDPKGTPQTVSVIQGNVSLAEKHNVKYFEVNRERYLTISKSISKDKSLIIWPESTITDFVPTFIKNSAQSKLLPNFSDGSIFLVGTVSYDEEKHIYNSAFFVGNNGEIQKPYHKRILMPFGEYTPFSSIFPWLKEINATAGDFTPGNGVSVFAENDLKVSPLICYEDILPSLARDSTKAGANLLVNMTNDAWFGKSLAPYQHHMIAAFRAIENRRFLVRSTNTGFTSIINPLGQTIDQLPIFSEGQITKDVQLLNDLTVYTKWIGDLPTQIAGFLGLILFFYSVITRRKT